MTNPESKKKIRTASSGCINKLLIGFGIELPKNKLKATK
jgi:hypothetical protein